jgi:hypothetical protein
VTITVTSNGDSHTAVARLRLIKENGDWKVCNN